MPKQTDTNRKRGEWAMHALNEFALIVDGNMRSFETDPEVTVTDLLADIRHFCDSKEIDFDDILEQANRHYRAEMMGDD